MPLFVAFCFPPRGSGETCERDHLLYVLWYESILNFIDYENRIPCSYQAYYNGSSKPSRTPKLELEQREEYAFFKRRRLGATFKA